jgi:CMP-N-acetylneuraminic acid synthetase/2-polyprenyl-3-methyl-5-hydroxy-6-metoxy-1,4-benzoquinol methylase
MKTIAIIPARGGSKGLYRKNIRDVAGKPLIYWQIKNALSAELVDDVVLASDDEEILAFADRRFIQTVKRPPEISTDTSKTEETLLYVLDQLDQEYDYVVTVEPTNPLNRPEYIDEAITKVSLPNSPNNACCGAVNDRSIRLDERDVIFERPFKKDIVPHLTECGNLWVTSVAELRETKNRLGKAFTYIEIPREDAYHLDDESDWVIINALMRRRLLTEPGRYCTTRPRETRYDESYWKGVTDPDGKVRDKTQERQKHIAECRQELDYINALPVGKVLDVGCGLGFLLSAIDDRWEKHGVEISEYAAEQALKHGTVLCGVLQGARYPDNHFDVVLWYHVIEHLESPAEELLEIRRILKPGGKLIVGTPNFGCELARNAGENFRLLQDKTHVSLFTAESLQALLRDAFFEIEDVRYPYLGTEYHTGQNLMRTFWPESDCPPFHGNIVTVYAYKK